MSFPNKIPAGGKIEITNAPNLALNMDVCVVLAGITDLDSCTYAGNVITLVTGLEIPASTSIQVRIGTFTSPLVPTTTSFTVRTVDFNTTGFTIDSITTNLIPILKC
jgi:hypothetical protein